MRRWTGNMNGERYCCNKKKREIHDLDMEVISRCQIDEIIMAGNDIPCTSVEDFLDKGYAVCQFCLTHYKRKKPSPSSNGFVHQ